MSFEYIPRWIKSGKRCKCFYKGKWYGGKITSTPKENDRGVDIMTDSVILGTSERTLGIMVYMCNRTSEQWHNLLRKEVESFEYWWGLFRENKRLWDTYQLVTKEDKISGTISYIETKKGAVFIALDNGDSIGLNGSGNYEYTEVWLSKFLKIGDVIYKESYSDSLLIYRNYKEYYFLIGMYINR